MNNTINNLDTMTVRKLLKTWNGEYSFLWSTFLKYLWKLTTKYMKASFNLISKNPIFAQNIYSVIGVCPLFLRNLHLRTWVNCHHHHWRPFLFVQSPANDKENLTHHWSVLPWTSSLWLSLGRAIRTGSQTQSLKSSELTPMWQGRRV